MKLSRRSFLTAVDVGAFNVNLPNFVHAATSLNPEETYLTNKHRC